MTSLTSVQDKSLPAGCTIYPNHGKHSYTAIFNSAISTKSCGNVTEAALIGEADLDSKIKMQITHDVKTATITLSGPSNVWFGVGFGAAAMSDLPYAIIVEGDGKVYERKLSNHGPGNVLPLSIKVVSQSVDDGTRTLVLERPVKGQTKDHFSLPTIPGDMNVISAIGDSIHISYHHSRSGGIVTLLPTDDKACVCQPTTKDFISYMNTTQSFNVYDCLKEPRSNMGQHGDGTGRNVPNQACQMETYHGGLQCCKHSWLLTDRDQDELIPKDKIDTYFLKWR